MDKWDLAIGGLTVLLLLVGAETGLEFNKLGNQRRAVAYSSIASKLMPPGAEYAQDKALEHKKSVEASIKIRDNYGLMTNISKYLRSL